VVDARLIHQVAILGRASIQAVTAAALSAAPCSISASKLWEGMSVGGLYEADSWSAGSMHDAAA
jgi:hypothetical protein